MYVDNSNLTIAETHGHSLWQFLKMQLSNVTEVFLTKLNNYVYLHRFNTKYVMSIFPASKYSIILSRYSKLSISLACLIQTS